MTHQKLLNEIRVTMSDLIIKLDQMANSGKVHSIDTDILLEVLREIYLKTSLLKNNDFTNEQARIFEAPKAEASAPMAQQFDSFEITDPAQQNISGISTPRDILADEKKEEEPLTFSNPPATEIKSPPIPEITTRSTITPQISDPVQPKPSVHQPDLFGNGSISEKFRTETPSLNDIISPSKSDHTLADKINLTPIRDIKSAIGINEKFQFINELFEGSTDVYNDAISLLNSCIGIEAARELFADFQLRNNWDPMNAAYKKLKEYIERRYLAN